MNLNFGKISIPFFFLFLCASQSFASEPVEPAKEAPTAVPAATTGEAVKADTAGAEQTTAKNEPAKADTYVIQPGDVLQIDVWKEKDLLREMMVRPDGGMNFPLVGEMVAAGKTVEQLRDDLKGKLAKYVPDPVVTVSVKEGRGNRIYVIGKVNRPGEYVATRNMDVMQALSLAGGLNPYASENNIKILRRVSGEQKTFRFKYSRVEKGEDLEQNIILQGGDVVVVP